MELNVNSPAYYSQECGVDDEIYWMCRGLADIVKEKKYSETIQVIGIVPIVAPAEVLKQGLFKAHKKCENKYGYASVSMHINYDEYVGASISQKKVLIVRNILDSVKSIAKKGNIDYDQFEKDILTYCQDNDISV